MMDAHQIQFELKLRGFFQADLARALKVSRMTISGVVHGRTKSRRVAEAIAAVLEKPVDELWPGAYPPDYVVGRKQEAGARIAQVLAKIGSPDRPAAAA